jgi:predicted hydrocarbon binding protein
MHGIIFSELKHYVESKLGPAAWEDLLVTVGIPGKMFLATQTYPDNELVAIVAAASRLARKGVPALLEDFGQHILPTLLQVYRSFINPRWKALDLLEHTEEAIHKVVRIKNRGATPPELTCARLSPEELAITYSSPRRMCGLAKGIIKGIARHYGEKVNVSEFSCMHSGAASCLILVRQASESIPASAPMVQRLGSDRRQDRARR